MHKNYLKLYASLLAIPYTFIHIIPCAYLPFDHGPRTCIGMRFAPFEMKMALISILQKYRIVLAPETEVRELTKNRCVVVSTCMLKRLVNFFSSLFEESIFVVSTCMLKRLVYFFSSLFTWWPFLWCQRYVSQSLLSHAWQGWLSSHLLEVENL